MNILQFYNEKYVYTYFALVMDEACVFLLLDFI